MTTAAAPSSPATAAAPATETPLPPPTFDNETQRERIIIQGGLGGGALTKVASKFRDLVHSLATDGATANTADVPNEKSPTAIATALQTELLLHDLEIRKLLLSARASDTTSTQYDHLLTQLQSAIASTREEITSLTSTLEEERTIQQHRQEYNSLAALCNSNKTPPIRTSQLELQRVHEEIERVEKEVEGAQWELNVREKQMRTLMACLGDLKSVLREENFRKGSGIGNAEEDGSEEGGGRWWRGRTGKEKKESCIMWCF
eukprot:g13998.t1 g13998   contig9:922882-923664(-)